MSEELKSENNKIKKDCLFKIEINNFKSIQKIELNILNDVHYLIGKNESGKSNILDALWKIQREEDMLLWQDKNFNINNSENEEMNILFSSKKWEKNKLLQKMKENNQQINNDQKNDFFNKINSDLNSFDKFDKKIIAGEVPENYFDDQHIQEILNVLLKYIFNAVNTTKSKTSDLKKDLTTLFQDKYKIFKKDFWNSVLENLKNNNYIGFDYEKEKIEILHLLRDYFSETESSFEIIKFKYEAIKSKYWFKDVLEDKIFMGFWKKLEIDDEKNSKLIQLIELSKKKKSSDWFLNEFHDIRESLTIKLKERITKLIEKFSKQKTINFRINIFDEYFYITAADILNTQEKEIKKTQFKEFNIRGKGMSNFLSISFFLSSINYSQEKNIIILFDEPDQGLHAQAVLDFKGLSEELVLKHKNLSILIATHNPFFIDEDNMNKIWMVEKENSEGTIIHQKMLAKPAQEGSSTLSPFLYKLGIDRESWVKLNESIPVFVEGYSDMLLFQGMLKHFMNKSKPTKEKYKKILFIPLGGAAKQSTLINVIAALSKYIPCFVFDCDEEGVKVLTKMKNPEKDEESYWVPESKNVFLNNVEDESKFRKCHAPIETQNLFEGDEFKEWEISDCKNSPLGFTNFCLQIRKALTNKEIPIKAKTEKNFKKVFDEILLIQERHK